jgi:hypothetical protein
MSFCIILLLEHDFDVDCKYLICCLVDTEWGNVVFGDMSYARGLFRESHPSGPYVANRGFAGREEELKIDIHVLYVILST